MKIGTWILTIWLAANAWAQTSAPKAQAAKPTAVSTAPAPAKTTAAAGKNAAAAAPAGQTADKTKQQPARSAAASGAALTAKHGMAKQGTAKPTTAKKEELSSEAKPEAKEAKPVARKFERKGRRDPFVSPIVEKMSNAANCTGAGKRCLYIGDVRLLGIVQSSNSVIAVVESGRHTYFLREQDPLADGDVERITTDAITLRQRSSDVMGRPVVRQVIKKLGSPAV